MASEADYRLPRSVIPSHYMLSMEPDLDEFTFVANLTVEATVAEPTSVIVLNSLNLDISDVHVIADGLNQCADVTYDEENQRASFAVETELSPGPITLRIAYSGPISEALHGFYRSTYRGEDGNEKRMASTQFESTFARYAMPCWDEPDLKATFSITIITAPGLFAVSNGPETDRCEMDDGRIKYVFGESPIMSTYLVAFVVGDLVATEPIDVDGVPLRIITPPGKEHLTSFALDAGAHALRYFANYYDVPYPGDKLDMVAIPDFAWGAMENLGCITYRETALLIDEDRSTQAELVRVATVIAHEIAHMWFGDLVTMKWWNGIWLNEAFATFAETKCTDAFRPDWNYWLMFANDRARSQETDALATTRSIEFPVASPAEADGMFDVLTYEKGASVLRMMEQYVGEEAFRKGVSLYLKKHAYSNTDNSDLWAALEEASGEPVGDIMDTWIFQGGYPVMDIERDGDDVTMTQRQFRYLGEGDTTWLVPVRYRDENGVHRVLVDQDSARVPVEGDVVVNAGGEGFFRTVYDTEMFATIRDHFTELDPVERFGVISDANGALLKGSLSLDNYLDLLDEVKDESEKDVWMVALSGLAELDRVVSSDDQGALQRFVGNLVDRAASDLGWVAADAEDEATSALRGQMLRALGNLADDPETIAYAREVEGADTDDAEVADAALAITASHGDLADFERFIELSENAPTPQLTVKYLRSATVVPDPDVPQRIIGMILSKDIRPQDSFWVLAVLLGTKTNGARAWEILTENWDEVFEVVPHTNGHRILDQIQHRTEPEVAAAIKTWLEEHPIASGGKAVPQRLEMLEVRSALRERVGTRIGEVLGD